MRGAGAVATRPLPTVPALASSRAETVLPSATPSSIVAVVFGHRPAVMFKFAAGGGIEVYGQSWVVVS